MSRRIPSFVADRVLVNVRRVFAAGADRGKSPRAVARYYLAAELRTPEHAIDPAQLEALMRRAERVVGRSGALGDLAAEEGAWSPDDLALPAYTKEQLQTISTARVIGALGGGVLGFRRGGVMSTLGFGLLGAIGGGMVGGVIAGQPEGHVGDWM